MESFMDASVHFSKMRMACAVKVSDVLDLIFSYSL